MDELLRAIEQLMGRFSGPMHIRLLTQPMMSVFLAFRAGARDANQQKPAFLWEVIVNPTDRKRLLQSAWRDVARLFVISFLVDTAYQFLFLHFFYPLQSLIVACALAVVPYVLLRGPTTRLVRKYHHFRAAKDNHVH